MFASFRNMLSAFQEEESSTESNTIKKSPPKSRSRSTSMKKSPAKKSRSRSNSTKKSPAKKSRSRSIESMSAKSTASIDIPVIKSSPIGNPDEGERQLALVEYIQDRSTNYGNGPVIASVSSIEDTIIPGNISGSSAIGGEEGLANFDIIKTRPFLFFMGREARLYEFENEKEIVSRIVDTFTKNKKSGYSNAVGITNAIPLVYTNMLTFKEKRYTDLVKFYDLGLEYLKIRQSEFYDLFHMMYYNDLMDVNKIPYQKEDVVYISKLKQSDLLHLVNVVTNDTYRGDRSHSSLLLFLLSCGIESPINVNNQSYTPRIEKYSEWNPFQILTYILLFTDRDASDYSRDVPYKTAYTLLVPSNGKIYDMIASFPFDKEPTIDDLKRELYKMEIKVEDSNQDMIEFYFYEFIPALKMAMKK